MGRLQNWIRGGIASVVLVSICSTVAFAEPYGSGTYSGCNYNACPPPVVDPTPIPPTPAPQPAPIVPTPVVPAPNVFTINVNLEDNQEVRGSTFILRASVSQSSQDPQKVFRIVFYVGNELLGVDYDQDNDGTFVVSWPLEIQQASPVSIVAYSESGEVLARRDVPVTVTYTGPVSRGNGGSGNNSGLPVPNNSPQASSNPIVSVIQNIVSEDVKQALRSVPQGIARSFPYWLFIVLFIFIIILLTQAAREAAALQRMSTLLKREKLIAEDKDNFIALASHYLRTPLTLINGAVDTMQAIHQIEPPQYEKFQKASASLEASIKLILQDVETDKNLKNVHAPVLNETNFSPLRSLFFWVPVASVALICVVANLLLGVAGEIDLGIGNLWVQAIVFAIIVASLNIVLRQRHIKRVEHSNQAQLVEYQAAVDAARNNFILELTQSLNAHLGLLGEVLRSLPSTSASKIAIEGYNRLVEILRRLELLSRVRSGTELVSSQPINVARIVEDVLQRRTDELQAKNLTFTNTIGDVSINHDPELLTFVFESLIDNAIKFSHENGHIMLGVDTNDKKVRISIEDNGIGIPQDKLPRLFSPFSRADSAVEFKYEGMGFSLFLDRIIMNYIGGDIAADSTPNKGTTITVSR